MFPVIEVKAEDAESIEQLGTKSKFWYRDGNKRMLFKAEDRGTGEDWAEKIACELCALLGLPHVHYEMAFDSAAMRTRCCVSDMYATPFVISSR